MTLEGINRTAWGTRLFLTAVLASLVDSTRLCPILRAQHCCLSPNGCFNLVSRSQTHYALANLLDGALAVKGQGTYACISRARGMQLNERKQ